MNAPLYEHLMQLRSENRISFSMPGHKGRISSDFIGCDVTELSKTADLHEEEGAVKAANDALTSLYGTKRSFILSSGSTTAIQAMVLSAAREGDTILVSEDCHLSVINACVIAGVNIRIAKKDFDSDFLIPTGLDTIGYYLDKYEDISAVLITSPNYYGICADIEQIAAECHNKGIPLLVDEAHGAHFIASDLLPKSAVRYADLVCHSAHKTLNALTGAAYLHVCSDLLSYERVRECINMFESSSPSYAVAASADTARSELENSALWDDCAEKCGKLRGRLADLGLTVLENDDVTRFVISGFNMSGYEADRILSDEYSIDAEMSDLRNIVLIVTPYNTDGDFNGLLTALKNLPAGAPKSEIRCNRIERNSLISPRRAFFAQGKFVKLSDAAGHIGKATVAAYPPGTPIIISGERISYAQVELIERLKKSGAKIKGMNKDIIEIAE